MRALLASQFARGKLAAHLHYKLDKNLHELYQVHGMAAAGSNQL